MGVLDDLAAQHNGGGILDQLAAQHGVSPKKTYRTNADFGKTDAEVEQMRQKFIQQNNPGVLTRLKDQVIGDIAEPFKVAAEAITAPVSALHKAYKGLTQGAPTTLRALANGQGLDNALSAGTQAMGQTSLQSPIGPSRLSKFMGEDLGQGLDKIGRATGQPELVQGVAEAVGDISSLAALRPGVKAVGKAGAAVKEVATSRLPNIPKLDKNLDYAFNKAVRPGVAGNRSAPQAKAYADNARTAVKEIVLNKDNLGFVDDVGEPIKTLPQNLGQFRQAIDSTKRNIWDRVEAINKSAGTETKVSATGAVDELRALANHPEYVDTAPQTAIYEKKKIATLTSRQEYTVPQAQKAITIANQSLKNFYSAPSPESASRAAVDALVANHLRSNLDLALEAATGTPAAAPLRKSYGALKTIEKDVNQRAVVDARKNAKGLIDFADIMTAGELMSSMATMNPAGVAKAGMQAFVKSQWKRLNNPNTHVKNLFRIADRLVSKAEFDLPQVSPPVPREMPQPPWAGKVNTGGLVQPGPRVQRSDMQVNQGGLVQPETRSLSDLVVNTGRLGDKNRSFPKGI